MNHRVTWRVIGALTIGVSLVWAQAKQPQPKSQKEVDAIVAIQNAMDDDSRIKAAQDLLTNFADTEFKLYALQMIAMSYQMKNDLDNMMIWSERILAEDPKNYNAMLMLAQALAQRTREFDLDKEEKLNRAAKYARSAQEIIQNTAKPRPDITDEQWEEAKKDLVSQAHEALGMVALARKKYDEAIAEFKNAVQAAANPDPATKIRLGATYSQAGRPDEAIAVLSEVIATPDLHPQLKQFAEAEKSRAEQAKGAKKP